MTYEENLKELLELINGVNATPSPRKVFFNSADIRTALQIGLFSDREGFVVYGGIEVIDTIKRREPLLKIIFRLVNSQSFFITYKSIRIYKCIYTTHTH